jgi:hypothetical protein
MQMVAIVGAVQLQWPGGAREFFDFVDSASSFTTSGLATECLLGDSSRSPYSRTGLIYSMPLWLFLFAGVLWLSVARAERSSPHLTRCLADVVDEDDRDRDLKSPRSPDDARGLGPRGQPTDEFRRWRDRFTVSCIVIAFLVHTPLTNAAFRIVTCRPVSAADGASAAQLRLVMDLDVLCTDPAQRSAMLGMALPMILLVSLGIPAGAAFVLRRIGMANLQDKAWRNLLGFLISGYKPELYFWECVVLLRKVLLAAVTTTLAPAGPGMQLTTSLLVILAALILHARFMPHVDFTFNALESASLGVAALTMLGGFYVVLEDADVAGTASGIAAPLASILIAVMNSVFLIIAVVLLSRRVRAVAARWSTRNVRNLRRMFRASFAEPSPSTTMPKAAPPRVRILNPLHLEPPSDASPEAPEVPARDRRVEMLRVAQRNAQGLEMT